MLDVEVLKAESLDTEPVKVLIIEDEEAHFQLMKRAIRKELPEISVRHFSSAAACVEEIDNIHPEIILVDYLLPAMNGIEFLAAIKQKGLDIPVVMITGQGDEGIAVHAMKLGAQDYLVKNAEFFSLLPSVIEQVIRERRLKCNLNKAFRLNELLLNSLPYPAMMIRRDRKVLAANQIARKMGALVGELCWKTFRFDSHSEYRQKVEGECAFCRENDMFQQEKAINIPELTKDGRVWDIWWIPIDQNVFLHYAIDITDRKKAEYKLLISSRFLEIANQHEKLDSLLKAFVQEVKSKIGCGIAASWIFKGKGEYPLIFSEGCDPQLLVPVAAMTGMNQNGTPLHNHAVDSHEPKITTHESLSFGDALSTHVPQSVPTEKEMNENPFNLPDFKLTEFIPVRLKKSTLGFIFLADTKKKMLPPDEMEIAATAAMKLAIAVERIQSRELLKKSEQTLRFLSDQLMSAQEEERKKISRELHDSIGSSLAAIRLLLQTTLERKLERKPLKKILSLISGTIVEVRRIMADLRPSFIDELGIIGALDVFCRQFAEIHPGISLKQQVEIEENEVPESLKIIIFRIVQESFNNIVKYSKSKTVTLELVKQKNVMRLSIIDDGIGFNLNSVEYRKELGTGIGLVSMKERTELSGGIFVLKSSEGEGTTIIASWPFLWEIK